MLLPLPLLQPFGFNYEGQGVLRQEALQKAYSTIAGGSLCFGLLFEATPHGQQLVHVNQHPQERKLYC